jgi:hypothetical protein
MRRGVLLAICCSVVALAATGRDRSEAIYPTQHIPLKFSHQVHLEEGADCTACHDPARKSVKATDVLTPKGSATEHAECDSCHDIEAAKQGKAVDPPSKCETCHIGYDKAQGDKVPVTSFPSANLVFNHKVHFDRKIECGTCHFSAASGKMDDVGLATRFQLPKMETCLACHNGTTAPAECRTCHLTDPSGRMQLTFASATLRPIQGDPLGLDHGPRYEFTHSTRAKLDRSTCMECHNDNFCTRCHDSLQKPLSVHPNDYITLHPLQAKMDSMVCQSCHRLQSFCAACHERSGVGLNSDPNLRARNLSVHGDYAAWVLFAGPNHHAIAAARDIQQCVACHREETCTACHATNTVPAGPAGQGRIVDPHPPGFQGLCKNLAAANSRGCQKCHSMADLQTRGCM